MVNSKETNLDVNKFENVDDFSLDKGDVGCFAEKKIEGFGSGGEEYLRIDNQLMQIAEKARIKTTRNYRRLNPFEGRRLSKGNKY